jgi:D-alanyl-D-alanine carboxypeptidase
MPYQTDSEQVAFKMFDIMGEIPTVRPFAASLAVVPGDISGSVEDGRIMAAAAGLFCVDDKEPLYAKNVYERLHPASLTKVMTALVALKYGTIDTYITASANVNIVESGAQVVGLKQGDQMTLAQALHLALINSANDAAIMVAEGVAGSVEEFCNLMNKEAQMIGATNTNFINPHGLTDDEQYTTVYDMYLILNAAIKYDIFNQIVQMPSYTTTYLQAGGNSRELTVNSTNWYLQGTAATPENVIVVGGKTGTTSAARHCLAIVSKDNNEKTYISVVMRADGREVVYGEMTELLRVVGRPR